MITILCGEQCRPQWLINWLAVYARHVDVSVRYEIASAYTAFGSITGIGNVYPIALAALDTNFFSHNCMRSNSVMTAFPSYFTVSASIMAQYAYILQFASVDDSLEDMHKSFIKLSPKQLRVNQRGSCVTFDDLLPKLVPQYDVDELKHVTATIHLQYLP